MLSNRGNNAKDGVISTVKLALDKDLILETLDRKVKIVVKRHFHNEWHFDGSVEYQEFEKKNENRIWKLYDNVKQKTTFNKG